MQQVGKKSGWNPSRQLIDQFVLLLNQAESSFYQGRLWQGAYQNCFFKTREIRLLISPYLTETETEHLDKLEKEILDWWAKYQRAKKQKEYSDSYNFNHKKNNRILINAKNKHWQTLQEYRYLMNNLANVHGFGISESQDQTQMF